MGNSFAITLASKNWNQDVAAWELAVLRLPGAQIDDVFHLGNRLDPAWYEAMPEQGLLRWVRGENAPAEITVLMQAPPPTPDELPPRWKKAGIVLPVAGAIVVALIAAIPVYLTHRTAPKEQVQSTEMKPPVKPGVGEIPGNRKEAQPEVHSPAKAVKAVSVDNKPNEVKKEEVQTHPNPDLPDAYVQNPAGGPNLVAAKFISPSNPNPLPDAAVNLALPAIASPASPATPQPSPPNSPPPLTKAVLVAGPETAQSARIARIFVEKADSSEARDILSIVSTTCLSGSPFSLATDGHADARLRYAGSPQANQMMFLFESNDGARSSPYYAFRETVGRAWRVEPVQAAEDICTDFLPRKVDSILKGK
jgi:hypothetical protein